MTNIYLQLSWNLLHWRDVLEFSETRFFNECKRHCFLSRILVDTSLHSTPESGSLINTPELVNISPAWAGSCVLWMLTSLCCGKFLANTLPPPSSLRPLLTPLTGVFTLREQISGLLAAAVTSSWSLSREKIAPRSFPAGIDTASSVG